MQVSIIIPTLNEEKVLANFLQALQTIRQQGAELIVVDGGSVDKTLGIAEKFADQIITTHAGRAHQLHKGADNARGSLLLFLHADTQLPADALSLLAKLPEETLHWGCFEVKLENPKFIYRVIEKLMNWRSGITSVVTGDQAMFVSKQLYLHVGGYPDIALMEDIAISKRLKRVAKPYCLSAAVTTSCRRWEKYGVLATIVLMWRLRCAYFFGADPNRLSQLYRAAK